MRINGVKNNPPSFGIRCPNPNELVKTLHNAGGFHTNTARAIVEDLKNLGSKNTILESLSILRRRKSGFDGVQMVLKTGLEGDTDKVTRRSSFSTQFFDRKDFVNASKKAIASAEEGYIKSRVLKAAAQDAITPNKLDIEHSARMLSDIYPEHTKYIDTAYKYAKTSSENITKASISLKA